MAADTTTRSGPVRSGATAAEVAGLDALELAVAPRQSRLAALWSAAWPKVAALAIVLGIWQLVVWSGWKPEYALAPPSAAWNSLRDMAGDSTFWGGVATTMRRGLSGFALAVLIGSVIGLSVSRVRVLRTAVGSLITGLQTMPSIAWFPLAILLFGLSEQAILFVVVLGAAPSVANGLIAGVDYVPPLLLRAGRTLGARGWTLYRHVVVPAALPSFVAGLKQGWAFAWRSLLAGEIIVIIANKRSLGADLQSAREFSDAPGLLATMIVILVIGILVDIAFNAIDHRLRSRRGMIDTTA